MNGIIIFVAVFFGSVILGLAVFLIYMFGRKSARNNPTKATIIQLVGHEALAYRGVQYGEPTKNGTIFQYGKGKFITWPKSYKNIYHKSKLMIFVNHRNQLVASPFDKDVELSSDEKNDLIYELVAGHIGADGMRALRGHSGGNMILIGIVCLIVGALLSYGANYVINMKAEKDATAQTPAITQTTTDNVTINQNNAVRVEHGQ